MAVGDKNRPGRLEWILVCKSNWAASAQLVCWTHVQIFYVTFMKSGQVASTRKKVFLEAFPISLKVDFNDIYLFFAHYFWRCWQLTARSACTIHSTRRAFLIPTSCCIEIQNPHKHNTIYSALLLSLVAIDTMGTVLSLFLSTQRTLDCKWEHNKRRFINDFVMYSG